MDGSAASSLVEVYLQAEWKSLRVRVHTVTGEQVQQVTPPPLTPTNAIDGNESYSAFFLSFFLAFFFLPLSFLSFFLSFFAIRLS
jgi:hypothetical protein